MIPSNRRLGWDYWEVSQLLRSGVLAIGDGYRAKNSEMGKSGLPFARAGNLNNGFHFDDADILQEPSVVLAGDKLSQPGDITFTSKGTFGRFAFVCEDTPRFVYSPQLCYWRVKRDGVVDRRFLYYWMQSADCMNQLNEVKGLTDMAAYVSLTNQRRMWLSAPPMHVQRRIADILSTYDDLIDNCEQRISVLDAVGRTLLRQWFVLFRYPDRGGTPLVESPLGPIPKNWNVCRLGELKSPERYAINGGPFGSKLGVKDYVPMGVPVIRGSNLTESGRFRAGEFVFVSGEKARELNANIARPYDIVVTQRGTLGQIGRIPGGLGYEEFVISQSQMKVTLDPDKIDLDYAFFSLRSAEARQRIKNLASSSGVPHINLAALREFLVLVPPLSLQRRFGNVVKDTESTIELLTRQGRVLRAARDLLLPRLLSGRLSVVGANVA